ncbi:MAG: hypothetical protein J6D18_03065 [Erysipelotrichaceae bacterium]|nr:hypothetical protein [Erysipelotrichaceae bacterium]
MDWGYSGGGLSVANNKWYAVQKGSLDWNYKGTLKCTDNRIRNFLKGVAA